MADRDKSDVLVALANASGKPANGSPISPRACGDIGLKIGRDGTWFYRGSPIGRKPLVKLFASVLRREGDGNFYLVTPAEKVSIEVEDAPFLAVSMRAEGGGDMQILQFMTNLDDTVTADKKHALSFRPARDGSFTPYVLLHDGLEARLTRAVYYDLVALATEKQGRLGVWSAGVFFPFPATQQ
jgi:hypothetical protein